MFWKYIQDIIKSKLEYNKITTLDLRDCYVKFTCVKHRYLFFIPCHHKMLNNKLLNTNTEIVLYM